MTDGLGDGSGQIELGAGAERAAAARFENGHEQSPAMRRKSAHRAVVLAEDHAGNMRAVTGGDAVVGNGRNYGFKKGRGEVTEADVPHVNRSIKDGDTNPLVALRLLPQLSQSWNDSNVVS